MNRPAQAISAPSLAVPIRALQNAALWLMVFSGFFVLVEPAPYELLALAAIGLFVITGLRLTAAHLPLIVLLFLYHFGAVLSFIPVMSEPDTGVWVLVGVFLAVTGLFFASVLTEDTGNRARIIMNAYTWAAVIVSLIGIAAYFRVIPSAETFLRYERVKGTFKDANVFAPFLILPAMHLLHLVLNNGLKVMLRASLPLGIILAALFLSFSRGAWAHFVISAVIVFGGSLLLAPRLYDRQRMILLAAAGLAGLVALIAVLLSFDAVADLFAQRASLSQDYDEGHLGRLNRHFIGFRMALDLPLGMGPLEFRKIFIEEPHNTYLNAFMSYGWLGGVAFPALVLTSIVAGIGALAAATPWRSYLLATLATFVGMSIEAWIIDIDHWRHFYLVLGVLWGLIAATVQARPARRSSRQPSASMAR